MMTKDRQTNRKGEGGPSGWMGDGEVDEEGGGGDGMDGGLPDHNPILLPGPGRGPLGVVLLCGWRMPARRGGPAPGQFMSAAALRWVGKQFPG